MIRLIVRKGPVDVSDEIELRDWRSNPFGWSACTIWHVENVNGAPIETRIGSNSSGHIICVHDDYSIEGVEEPDA